MANLDLNKILEEIKKQTSESGVRGVKVGNEEVFTKNEKDLLDSTRLKSLDKVKEAANLLARIKVAEDTKKKDDVLLDDLEKERDDNAFGGSIVFRTLNVKSRLSVAISYLTFLSTGIPEKKEDREKKIKELEEELGKKRKEVAENNDASIPLTGRLSTAEQDEREADKKLQRRENLLSLVSSDPTTDFLIKHQGTDKKISSITINTVKDYTGSAL